MMIDFILYLGGMSLQASFVICVILIIRKLFSEFHIFKKYVMLLWIIPFVCLIFPWKLASPIGFWSNAPADYKADNLVQNLGQYQNTYQSGLENQIDIVHDNLNQGILQNSQAPEGVMQQKPTESQQRTEDVAAFFSIERAFTILGIAWCAGMIFFILHSSIYYWKLKRKLLCSINLRDNVYFADDIQVPIVLGLFRARIYIPSGIKEEYLQYVIAHEETHIKRNDIATKLIIYLITSIHWFNPLVWLAYRLMEKDMEMACDEETIQRIGVENKKAYATALLQLSVCKRNIFAVPLAFGEGNTKERIKNVMRYQKNMKIVSFTAILTGVLVAFIFMTKAEAKVVPDDVVAESSTSKEQMTEKDYRETEAETEKVMLGELTLEMVREAFANKSINQIDFLSYTNGEKQKFSEGTLNYYINYNLEYEGDEYQLSASYSVDGDKLENIYMTRITDSEMCWLYTVNAYEEEYPGDLEVFLSTKTEVSDWLTLELPKEYSVGAYKANLGIDGGALILPQAYEIKSDSSLTEMSWRYSGFIGRIKNVNEYFSLKNGKLDESKNNFPLFNHSYGEKIDEWTYSDGIVVMLHYNHDLYTFVEQDELKEKGIEITESTSDYWYFFFIKEGETEGYYLSMSTKKFSKEEAIAIAQTVQIK